MGGKSGGGGYDTGPMLEYGDKALDLQKQMYKDQKTMIQPWVNTGSSALDMLAGYLGLNSATSPSSRQQLIDQYTPQFTSTKSVTTPGKSKNTAFSNAFFGYKGKSDPVTTTTKSVNSAGLNSYVDELLAKRSAEQEADPNFGSLLTPFGMDQFQADPGYQFRLDEQNKAIERAAAARGQYYDPSTVKALTEYGGNLADQTYNDAYNRYNNDQNNIFNRLAAIAGVGQTATGQMTASGQNYANQAGNIYGQMGNAVTSANAAKASQPSMFDTLLGGGLAIGSAGSGSLFSKMFG